MNNQQKITLTISELPVLADYLEDLIDDKIINQRFKQLSNDVIRAIRRLDVYLIDSPSTEDKDKVIEQQINLQRKIRQNHSEFFK